MKLATTTPAKRSRPKGPRPIVRRLYQLSRSERPKRQLRNRRRTERCFAIRGAAEPLKKAAGLYLAIQQNHGRLIVPSFAIDQCGRLAIRPNRRSSKSGDFRNWHETDLLRCPT